MTVQELQEKLTKYNPKSDVFVSVVVQRDPEGDWRQNQQIKSVGGGDFMTTAVCILVGYNSGIYYYE